MGSLDSGCFGFKSSFFGGFLLGGFLHTGIYAGLPQAAQAGLFRVRARIAAAAREKQSDDVSKLGALRVRLIGASRFRELV